MLLYAMTDEEITPDSSFQISNNKYHLQTLDLNRDFSEIASQLDKIITNNFENVKKQL